MNTKDNKKLKWQEYYQKNKKELAAKKKEYMIKNREKVRETQKKYYEKNKDKIDKKNKIWRTQNRDKVLSCKKKSYQKNKKQIQERQKPYYAKWRNENKDKIASKAKVYRLKNREKINKDKRLMRSECHDSYITALLTENSSIKRSDIPNDLIELKRIQLQITRELRK